jgi:hypothetical protein
MKRLLRLACFACGLLLLATLAHSAYTQQPLETPTRVWLGPDGKPLPFKTEAEVMEFLRTAKVKSVRGINRGITAPEKVELEKDGVRAHAHFNFVSEQKPVATMRSGETVVNFRDSHTFQCAAYELATLLGLDNVPPVVPRRVKNRSGSLSIWIENSFTERDRIARKQNPPDPEHWKKQVATMKVFDALIFNTDRTQENILIDSNWKLWMIDHTRAFRREDTITGIGTLALCERNLFKRLQTLEAGQIRERLKPHLNSAEIDAILKRRAKLVAHFESLIQQSGEAAVLFDFK